MNRSTLFTTIVALLVVVASSSAPSRSDADAGPAKAPASAPTSKKAARTQGSTLAAAPGPGLEVATFAGGCFWCMEPPFEKLDGVLDAYSGYTGGSEQAPTYDEVARGRTGHTEAVHVVFDPKVVSYDKLLEVFWRSMDPTDAGGQFVDRGSQYRPGIFAHNEAQRSAAQASKDALTQSGRFTSAIVVPIETAADFWLAEDYHQDFYKKSEAHYNRYRSGSGRDDFIASKWGSR